MTLARKQLAELIVERMRKDREQLSERWRTALPTPHVWIDDLLPEATALGIAERFPDPGLLMQRDNMYERKKVGVELASYNPDIGEILFAFQEPPVLEEISTITGLQALLPDPSLYGSGISSMGPGDFLNPHLDNSHDGEQERYRILNLLYYVSPGWDPSFGGNLEMWDRAVRTPTVVPATFNRLALLQTNQHSWHSVSKVVGNSSRHCVSNYYFSRQPPGDRPYSHVTTFSGRPEQKIKRAVLKVDGVMRNMVGRLAPQLVKRTKHRVRTKAD